MRAAKAIFFFSLAAVLLLLGAMWTMAGAPILSIPPARIAAPEGFNAVLYPELDTVKSTDRAQVLNLGQFGHSIEHYFLPDIGVIYFMLFTDSDQSRIVFVNRKGALIGEITEEARIFPAGAQMVVPDATYQVTSNGISQRQPMQTTGPMETAQIARMIDESTSYLSFSSNDLPSGDPEHGTGRTLLLMHHGGVWKRIASAKPSNHAWKVEKFHELDAEYRISRAAPPGEAASFFGGRYRLELTHFDQQDFLSKRSAPMGSSTGTGREAHWVGTGYYTVFVDDAPALRFRIENDREYLSGLGPVSLLVEGSPELDLITVSHTNDENWRTVVVVSGR